MAKTTIIIEDVTDSEGNPTGEIYTELHSTPDYEGGIDIDELTPAQQAGEVALDFIENGGETLEIEFTPDDDDDDESELKKVVN